MPSEVLPIGDKQSAAKSNAHHLFSRTTEKVILIFLKLNLNIPKSEKNYSTYILLNYSKSKHLIYSKYTYLLNLI